MDYAHEWTEGMLEGFERQCRMIYSDAIGNTRKGIEDALRVYDEQRKAKKAEFGNTQEGIAQYADWLLKESWRNTQSGGIVDTLAEEATNANVRASQAANDLLPAVFAENANFAAFEIDKAIKVNTAFTLVDEPTVKHLMGLDETTPLIHEVIDMGPAQKYVQSLRKTDINKPRDIRWNRQKFTSAITQGILKGESIPNIVKRTKDIFGSNKAAAIRAARTACTSAENAGRISSYERAEEMGINLKQEWLATVDDRTRDSHIVLDGERVNVGESFSNGLRYPGDPQGDPSEVYNCRCTLVAAVDGMDQVDANRFSRLPDGMSYEEWKQAARDRLDSKKEDSEPAFSEDYGVEVQTEIIDFVQDDSEPSQDDSEKEEYKGAIEWYASGEGMHINQVLRNQGMSGLYENEKEAVRVLDKATNADKVDVPVLYRSVDASAVFGNMSQFQYEQLREAYVYNDSYAMKKTQSIRDRVEGGKTIVEKGFMSTSESYDVVADWYDFTGSDKPITLELSVPEGTTGCKVYELTPEVEAEDPQREVLLSRNTKYEIEAITARDGLIYVKAKILGK